MTGFPQAYAIGVPTGFRGLTVREGLVWPGAAGWAEWSPFLDYSGPELVPWLRAADEAAELGWPDPVRTDGAGEQHRAGRRPGAGRGAGAGRRAARRPR